MSLSSRGPIPSSMNRGMGGPATSSNPSAGPSYTSNPSQSSRPYSAQGPNNSTGGSSMIGMQHHLPGLSSAPDRAGPLSGHGSAAAGGGLGAGGPSQPTISQTVALILQLGAERNIQASQMLGLAGPSGAGGSTGISKTAGNNGLTNPVLIKLDKEVEACWVQAGRVAEAIGDWARALSSYETALRHSPYNIDALASMGNILRQQEKFVEASEYFTRFLHLSDTAGEVWGALGHCYLMIDDLQKAYTCYQQAIHHIPDAKNEPKLWYGIGILYDRYGSLEHAEEAFASVINTDPKFEKANEIYFRLGIIYKQQKNSHASLQCFKYILHNPPRPLTEIDIWFQIGHVYEQIQDYDSAKDAYDRVLAANPNHAKVLQQLGGLYHRRPASFYDPEKSVIILTKSLEQDANDPFSWYLLGRAYMTGGNYGKAYEAYQQAVYRDGKNPAFWCSIGVLYYQINQYHDSLDAYSRAIRINPYLSEVWHNLGALYESCNDQMNDAIDAYRRTLQLDETNEAVRQRLDHIEAHRKRGSPLSPPPKPKDISPSSTSWTFANSASGIGPPGPALAFGSNQEPHPSSPPRNGHPLPSAQNGLDRSSARDMDYRRRETEARASPITQGRSSISNATAQPNSHLPHLKGFQDSRSQPGGMMSHEPARRPTLPMSSRSGMDDWERRGGPEQQQHAAIDRRQTISPPTSTQPAYRSRAPAALTSFGQPQSSAFQPSVRSSHASEMPTRGSPTLLDQSGDAQASPARSFKSGVSNSQIKQTKSPITSAVKQPTSSSRRTSAVNLRQQAEGNTPGRAEETGSSGPSPASNTPTSAAEEQPAPTRQADEDYDAAEPVDSLMALASASSSAGPISASLPQPESTTSEAPPQSASLKITLKRNIDETDVASPRNGEEAKRMKGSSDTSSAAVETGATATPTEGSGTA